MRTELVTRIEDEANKAVAAQLAALDAPELTARESVLVLLGIRAGVGAALRLITEEGGSDG